jgi:hypothetical protein
MSVMKEGKDGGSGWRSEVVDVDGAPGKLRRASAVPVASHIARDRPRDASRPCRRSLPSVFLNNIQRFYRKIIQWMHTENSRSF